MRPLKVRLENLSRSIIPIGYKGEQNHTQVIFDCKSVFSDYPNAVPTFVIKPEKGEMYSQTVTRDGNFLTWNVVAENVVNIGEGEFQFTFTSSGDEIFKSDIGRYNVKDALAGSEILPEVLESVQEIVQIPSSNNEYVQPHSQMGIAAKTFYKGIKALRSVSVEGELNGMYWAYRMADNGIGNPMLYIQLFNNSESVVTVSKNSLTVTIDYYK